MDYGKENHKHPYHMWYEYETEQIDAANTEWFTWRRPQINNCKSHNNLAMKINLDEYIPS
jgi:uncharacterized lipoprotein YddW (UPF0748 family)